MADILASNISSFDCIIACALRSGRAARVTMSPSSLTLGPGQTVAVDITVVGDTNWDDSDRIIYSGYIKVIPESSDIGYSAIHVPYAGFKGNYGELQPISNDEIIFPDGAKVRGPSVIKVKGENGQPRFIPYDNKPFNLSAEIACIGFQVNHPVRNVKLLWLDSKTEKVLGIAGTLSDAQQLGKKNDAPFRLIMAGVSGDPKECVPGKGSYKFKLTLDSVCDDGTPVVHSFISDVIEVSSNEPKGACEKP
ncbi:hypothetical protein BKA69DRAFT_629647 [Paraphysoderma sedebokerense]|nr:hypothetical protein BKA69DRAFT_629647 [Paraphysoderma sedebokerense]